MTRLQTEFRRLYLPHPAAAEPVNLIDEQGRVRALVLEVAAPADWDELVKVWRGVQADLALPAPAIAASGTNGLQLWFSLSEPVAAASGHAFVDALRRHYLPDVPERRVRLWPTPGTEGRAPQHVEPVPALHEASGNWSAFVAPDLAPLFADTPWLDVPPGDDGQAHLLSGLVSIQQAQLAAAHALLAPTAATPQASHVATASPPHHMPGAGSADPKAFLQAVMNDPSVPLALRIEAAKALLRHPAS